MRMGMASSHLRSVRPLKTKYKHTDLCVQGKMRRRSCIFRSRFPAFLFCFHVGTKKARCTPFLPLIVLGLARVSPPIGQAIVLCATLKHEILPTGARRTNGAEKETPKLTSMGAQSAILTGKVT
jgi:hypothetical protein